MNEVDAKKLRATIKAEIARLKGEIVRLNELAKPVSPDNAIGRLSRLDNMINQGVSNYSLGQARTRLVKLEWMVEHMQDSEFGICEECGEDIPVARLQAVPESRLCVECAEDAGG